MHSASNGAPSAEVLVRHPPVARQCSSLISIQPHGKNLPLFWIHGDYSDIVLRRSLPTDQPLYGLLHQSRDGIRAQYTTVETIGAHYLEEIQTVQAQGPYLLGGFSFGGMVAFEMAQQLKRRGEDVPLLFLIDSQFPGAETADSHRHAETSGAMLIKLGRHVDEVSALSRARTLAYVRVRTSDRVRQVAHRFTRRARSIVCRGHFWMGRPIPLSLRSFYILQVYRNARSKYVARRYDGDMVYIQCGASGQAERWRSVVGGTLQVCDMPGDHTAIVKEPFATLWVEILKRRLDAIRTAARDNPNRVVRQ